VRRLDFLQNDHLSHLSELSAEMALRKACFPVCYAIMKLREPVKKDPEPVYQNQHCNPALVLATHEERQDLNPWLMFFPWIEWTHCSRLTFY
jgi:hypothetical protein